MSKEFFIRLGDENAWQNTKQLWGYMKSLPEGKYKISVEKSDKRSNDQNSYYWQMLQNYVFPGLREIGWEQIKSKEDAHDFMREMFLKVKEINQNTGEERWRIRSTTELTKMEFGDYLEDIWRFASEYLGIAIPGPDEQLRVV